MSELNAVTPGESTPADDFLSRPLIPAINLDWEKAIYLTFMVIAIITRFYMLGDRVVSHDESLHTQYSYQFYNGDGYVHSPMMHGPTLFHATALSYWLFGDSDFSARIPDAVLGVILVLMPWLLRGFLGRRGALFASFMLLISPYVSYYSRYIRHDVYLIVFALIVFIATWYYLRERKTKYLWWFTIGLVLMFATMEAAFIYVAIFGSFLVIRLLAHLVGASWLAPLWPRLRLPLLVALLGVVMAGAGLGLHHFGGDATAGQTTATSTAEGFAADPNAPQEVAEAAAAGEWLPRWLQLGGLVLFGLGLFLIVRPMRPHIDDHPEFDLIMLYTTLVLPLASPLLVRMAGWNPIDYAMNTCTPSSAETMSRLQLFFFKLGNATCRDAFVTSPLVRTTGFLLATIVVSILVGLWWNRKRWPALALAFAAVFLFFFTSIFTNLAGWRTGVIGSLGYWLEQQGVQRGSQPTYYYFFVTTFYEFLPIIFALAGIGLWLKQRRINGVVWFWVLTGLLGLLAYSLANYFFNRSLLVADRSQIPGLMAAAAVILIAVALWFLFRRRRILEGLTAEGFVPPLAAARHDEKRSQAGHHAAPHAGSHSAHHPAAESHPLRLRDLIDLPAFVDFVPSLIWWMALSWVAYSLAGEKMPWLSIHLTIPMCLLAGWYMGQRLESVDRRALFSRRGLTALGLSVALIVMAFVALKPLALGEVRLGSQEVDRLKMFGRFLGGALVAVGVGALWFRVASPLESRLRRVVFTLAVFLVLAGLTVRFSYMANFVNFDYTNEFMVYAHGAPATKSVVLDQLEELSMRLYGDKSIRVAFDSDVSWPLTWYLRDYPNRAFFGDNASQSLTESPVVIVGSKNWNAVDPYLANDYTQRNYTFLWWPMEEYRRFSWNAVFGDPADGEAKRGLGNRDVRRALWDIFFYRDYQKYGEVFGGNYTAGQWPLRHELRLYVRNDVLADLWDYGVGAVSAAPRVDPYEANQLSLSPGVVINESGVAGAAEGQLASPRNLAIGPDGLVYVLDSGNNRLQVFDSDGRFVRGWGGGGDQPGQFNEPWGLAVDDQFVYVADTWNHRIQKFSLDGQLVGTFGAGGSPSDDNPDGLGLFFGPRDIVGLADGTFLITDTGNHRLQVMTADGQFIRSVGGFGNQPGQFNEPVGLATGPDGSVFVADTWNHRIQRLTADLLPAGEWSVVGWAGSSINNKPYLAVDSGNRVYVTDPEGYRVLIFSATGAYLNRFGQYGSGVNDLALANGVALAADDTLWLTDAGNNRALAFPPIFGFPAVAPPGEAPVEEPGDLAFPTDAPPEQGYPGQP